MSKNRGSRFEVRESIKTFLHNLKWRRVFGRTKRMLSYRATSRCLVPLLKANGTLTGGRR